MDDAWIQEQITNTKALIAAYWTAITNLQTGAVQSWTLDTGQTKQSVTNADISSMQGMYDSLVNRLQMLYGLLSTAPGLIARPAW